MVMQCLTGVEFCCGTEGGVQGVRARQMGILFTMILYMSLLDCIDSSMEF